MNRVSVTLAGEDIPFDDYEFKNGDSRKVFSTNISMVDGNGGKVQTLIADTFEGYDAGKVKFFAKNGFIFCKEVAKLSNFAHLCVIFSNFPACQKSPKP
jgi:hypothetical protein